MKFIPAALKQARRARKGKLPVALVSRNSWKWVPWTCEKLPLAFDGKIVNAKGRFRDDDNAAKAAALFRGRVVPGLGGLKLGIRPCTLPDSMSWAARIFDHLRRTNDQWLQDPEDGGRGQ